MGLQKKKVINKMTNLIPINNQQNNQSENQLQRFSLYSYINEFLLHKPYSLDTKTSYKLWLETFDRCLRENLIDLPQHTDVEKYINGELQYINTKTNTKTGLKQTESTRTLNISILRKFFKWLEKSKKYPDITSNFINTSNRGGVYSRDSLSASEAKTLLDSLDDPVGIIQLRDSIFINLKLYTGVRDIEIYRANVDDVKEQKDKMVLVVQRKGHQAKSDKEFVVLNKQLHELISLYVISTKNRISDKYGSPLFVTHGNNQRTNGRRITRRQICRAITKKLKAVGLKKGKVVGHSLRHAFATRAIEQGIKIEKIQQILGHRDPATTYRYLVTMDRYKNPVEEQINYE